MVTWGTHYDNISGAIPKRGLRAGVGWIVSKTNASIDAPLLEDLHDTTFVNYLRICFRWGGFSEFEKYRRDNEIYLQHFQKLKSKEAIPNKKSLEKNIEDTEYRLQEIDSIITYLTEDLLPLWAGESFSLATLNRYNPVFSYHWDN